MTSNESKSTLSLKEQIRQHAENDLLTFIRLVHPNRVLGHVHEDVIRWMTRPDAKDHQLLLLPRDHQKSALIAYRCAWELTRNPALRILYISATINLAEKQLKFIKDILTSDIYRFYWPDMVNVDEGKREKWTNTEISVDHPRRKEENVRDPSIFTAGLNTTITGLHSDINVLDDIVVDENAYNDEGRRKVADQASYLASICGTESRMWVVGTRYYSKDQYAKFLEQVVEIPDRDGNIIESTPLFEVYERQVETNGVFLWPRTLGSNGKYYGFNAAILARKRAQYNDLSKFRAQYYNDPNDSSSSPIQKTMFQYYDKSKLYASDGKWYYGNRRLLVFAAIDFAYSLNKDADSSALVVIGVDHLNNIYVLDIDRFKTTSISEYYSRILRAHSKWHFHKLRAETTAAQSMIVEELKNSYIRPSGLALSIDGSRPTKNKEERIHACLAPRYENLNMWHQRGGNWELLEEELVLQRPPHDDIKDALTGAIEIAHAPGSMFMGLPTGSAASPSLTYSNKRFGGIG